MTYYIYFDCLTHGDGHMSKLVAVPEKVFKPMKAREADYELGNHPYELRDQFNAAWDQPAVDISDAELDAHPDEAFLRVTVC